MIGFYDPFRVGLNRAFGYSPTDQIPATSLAAGAASGAVGGMSYGMKLLAYTDATTSHPRKPSVPDQGSYAGELRFAPEVKHSLRTSLQAYSPALPVGAQHYYKHSWDALSTIWRKEGVRGLVRGVDAAVLRTSMGSSVQLPTYNWTKKIDVGGVLVQCRVTRNY